MTMAEATGNMTITTPRDQWPQWLRDADTHDARVEIVDGYVVWHGGTWHDGTWHGGEWRGGVWRDGEWRDGEWRDGEWRDGEWLYGEWHDGEWHGGEWLGGTWIGGTWHGGVWRDGVWHGGEWLGGTWIGGTWHGGVWRDGVWHGGTWIGGTWRGGVWRDPHVLDRLAYMLSMLGCVFGAEDGTATAYRSVSADLRGRCFPSFVQPRNQRVSVEHDPAGSGTCTAGLHASSAPVAWRYYGVDPTARLIRITFRRDDVLDCDGEKIRLAGGYCEEIPWPWRQ